MVAQRAAYEGGDEWLDGCVDYIRENRDLAYAFFAERLPEVGLHPLEGTYLMWLDMRKTGVEHETLFRRLIDVGGVGSTRACSSASRAGAFSASTWPRSAQTCRRGWKASSAPCAPERAPAKIPGARLNRHHPPGGAIRFPPGRSKT